MVLAVLFGACACGSGNRSAQRDIALAAPGPLVQLPADQAAHPSDPNEWWYLVGHLRSGQRTFGFETTIFKFENIRPPGFPATVSLYRTDVAITDESTHRFPHHISYWFPQSANLATSRLDVTVGNASLKGDFPHAMALRSTFGGNSINLSLTPRRGPMYVGGRGYIPFGDGYTYYYSLTNLATTGSLRLGGKVFRVTGISWLDHQWGKWSWATIRGWTWMAWQLDNGTQLSVFDFRSSASHVKAASIYLANGKQLTVRKIEISSLRRWTSPHSHGVYPSGWIVRIPELRATIRVAPTVQDQEMTGGGVVQSNYWEGSSRLRGTFLGKSVTGLGYTELTGFARAGFAGV